MKSRKANVGLVLVVLSAIFLTYGLLANYGLIAFHEGDTLFTIEVLILFIGGLASILLWLWMLYDFLKKRPDEHPVLWGLMLVFLGVLAAIAYYFSVYRKRV